MEKSWRSHGECLENTTGSRHLRDPQSGIPGPVEDLDFDCRVLIGHRTAEMRHLTPRYHGHDACRFFGIDSKAQFVHYCSLLFIIILIYIYIHIYI